MFPTEKFSGAGRLNIDEKTKLATLVDSQHRCIEQLDRVQLEWAGVHGIMISGYESVKNNKYRYQKWFLRYKNSESQTKESTDDFVEDEPAEGIEEDKDINEYTHT